VAKDTEKLVRQLSLISYLMAERRPVTALEIRQVVEGYAEMNEDAFARRFYADRAELESLGISLRVEHPADGVAEQETYSLPPENYYLPAVAFTDDELAALQTALTLLDGEFAYAEPLRLALQQLSWGRPSPLRAPDQRGVALGLTGSAGGHDLSQRLSKIETAIHRRKTITFDYYTMERDEVGARKIDPYQLLYQGGQFYLVGHSHERDAIRVFRLSRIRGKVAYATKAEHDFRRPDSDEFDSREYANRIDWQLGDTIGTAEVSVSERIAWQVERHFGRYGEIDADIFRTEYANPRLVLSWVLSLGENARLLGPDPLLDELSERLELVIERHSGDPIEVSQGTRPAPRPAVVPDENGRGEAAIRPERFARLVTLASILIESGRAGRRVPVTEVLDNLQMTDAELREDIQVLNVVNFGAGSYVLYAELTSDGHIEVDPDAYSDHFARPARLLPIEAKALVAAIDLIGEHIPAGSLASSREKIVAALGEDPAEEGLQVADAAGDDRDLAQLFSSAIVERRLVKMEYYKPDEDEFSERRVEPYALMNSRDGWYVVAFDPAKDSVRHFRLDRVKDAKVTAQTYEPRPEVDAVADLDGWPRTGEVPDSRTARVWFSPDRARWAAEERHVVAELPDGAIVVELSFAGVDWLVLEVLKEAGDAAVIAPADARDAIREGAERLLAQHAASARA
jgi:predicted DNA-binding transcriptional regulator YafY